MDVQGAEVVRKLLLLLDAYILEILVAKDDDPALRDQVCQLVLLAVVQLGELQPTDLRSDNGSELCDAEIRVRFREEILVLLVGDQAAVVKFEGLERGELGFLVVYREVVGVFVLQDTF